MEKKINKVPIKIIYWTPRILGILYILFISMFALDVFDGKSSLLMQVAGLLIHLLPSYILILALLVAWKKELPGGILFILLGLALMFIFRLPSFLYKLIMAAPVLIAGILFIIHHQISNKYKFNCTEL